MSLAFGSRGSLRYPAAAANADAAGRGKGAPPVTRKPTPTTAPPTAAPLPELTETQRRSKLKRRLADDARAAQADLLTQAVSTAAASSQPQATSASDRMAALRRRRGLTSLDSPGLPSATADAVSVVVSTESTTWTFLGGNSS